MNVTALYNLGNTQRLTGRFDEAIDSYRATLSLSPDRGGVYAQLGVVLLLKGAAADALAETQRESSDACRSIGLPMAYYALGKKADSDAALAALIAEYTREGTFNIAYVYAVRHEPDKAFEWLDKAASYDDPGLTQISREQLFQNIESDPRWLPFLRKVGRAPEQLARIKFTVPRCRNRRQA